MSSFLLYTQGMEKYNTNKDRDLHSHFDPNYPKIAHFVKKYQKEHPKSTLTVDSGDWFSGTMFKMIGMSYLLQQESPELEFFNYLDYDAVALGNHEFDGHQNNLVYMIKKANNISGMHVPILTSNMEFGENCDDVKSILKEPQTDEDHHRSGVYFTKYSLKRLYGENNQSILAGMIGIYGPNSAFYTENKRTCISFRGYNDTHSHDLWDDYTHSVHSISTFLREKVGVDIVVGLVHAGDPEDVNLINSLTKISKGGLPIIDVHIGAHTHQVYGFMKDGIYVSNAGDSGIQLGVVELEYNVQKNTRLRVVSEDMHLDVEKYPFNDLYYRNKVDDYIRILNNHFLNQIPFKYNTPIVTMKRDLSGPVEFAKFAINAIYHQMNAEIENKNSIYKNYRSEIEKIDIFFTSWDYIRPQPQYLKKNATLDFSNIFDLLGIGDIDKNINAHSLPYDPIVHWYVPKSKVQEMVEASQLYAKFVDSAADFVFSDSFTYKWTWFGIPYVKSMCYDMKLYGKPYEEWPKMIHFAAPAMIANFLPKASLLTKGLVDFIPKDKYGRNLPHILDDEYTYFRSYLLVAEGMPGVVERDFNKMNKN
eukprot:gene560-8070_t